MITDAYSQDSTNFYKERWKINTMLIDDDYYGAILKSDKLIGGSKDDASIFYLRGIANYYLMDNINAKKDLSKAKKLGFNRDKWFVKFMTDTNYVIEVLSESYLDKNLLLAENGYKPDFGLKDSLQGALRPERTCFDVTYYDLSVKVHLKKKSISGKNNIYFIAKDSSSRIQLDLSDSLNISSISMNGKELNFSRVFNAIFIDFAEPIRKGNSYMISVNYSGKPRVAPSPPWNGGFVWSKKKSKHWVGVACEHLGASSWWPCKDHLSEKPDSMSINIEVPSKYMAVSNGNLRSVKQVDKKYKNYRWFVSYPINSYCVTLYVGDFVNFNEVYTNETNSYNLDYYVLPHNLKKAKKFYSQTKDIVEVYEELYGEYPYLVDGIAMVEAPYAGMEHQSAIAIGDNYGKKERWYNKKIDYDYLIIHELAHEWWGNTVTMKDMADAWISEGFTTYTEQLFIEKKYGYEEYLRASAENMFKVMNIWPVVGIPDVNDNSFLGGDIYNKGATMLNNLRCIINNDSLFFGMIKKFYTQNKFKTIETSDFIKFVYNETGDDLSAFFKKFLYDNEPPILEYSFTHENNRLEFTYKWINVEAGFKMPFSLTFNDNYCYRLEGTTKETAIIFENIESFYIPNIFRCNEEIQSRNSFTYFWTSWKH